MRTLILTLITLALTMPTAFAKEPKSPPQNDSYKIQYLNLSWWEKYNDPILTGYIQEIYEKNHDLKIAALKVKEGEKLVKISFANQLPQVGLDGNFGRTMPSSDQQFGNLIIPSFSQYNFQMPLTASYEVDIWGQNRLKTKSVEKQLEMIKQDEKASYIALTSAFASDYFNAIKTDKLIEIQKELVATQKEISEKTEKKFQNGLCSENEVLTEEKLLTSHQEGLNNLITTQFVLNNQLRVYLSDNDKNIKRLDYEGLSILTGLPEELDSSVIEERPDYLMAEDYIKKIGLDVKVAKKEFLPKFLIYGQLGFNAYQWGRIFNTNSQLANAGIMPSLDLFTGGRKMAILKLKKYQYEEAIEKYKKTILTDIQEVNDSAAILKTQEKNYNQSVERLRLEDKKYTLMTRKNQIGASSNLDVLYYKEQKLLTQKDEVSNKINFLISTIGLYKAVGGKDLYSLHAKNEKIKEDI